MSTIAFRASLVREIEQAMKQRTRWQPPEGAPLAHTAHHDGAMEAYAHILTLVMDEDL